MKLIAPSLLCVLWLTSTLNVPAQNNSIGTALPLTMVHDPSDVGNYAGRITNSISAGSEVDYWSFDALAGDVVSLSVDTPSSALNPYIQLRNSADGVLVGNDDSGPDTDGFISHFTITSSGTYYALVGSSGGTGGYQARVDLVRGLQIEADADFANDTIAGANVLRKTTAAAQARARVAGTIMAGGDVDTFYLGRLNAGNMVDASTRFPAASSLNAQITLLTATNTALVDADGNTTNGHAQATVASDGDYYVRVTANLGSGPAAQYLLEVTINDTVAPQITQITRLPAANGTTDRVISTFTVTFDEDLDAGGVNAGSPLANWDLREDGSDSAFDTPDDVVYSLATYPTYVGGTNVSLLVLNGPLPNGRYRFRIQSSISDVAGNSLDGDGNGIGGDSFSRSFFVAVEPGHTIENSSNDTLASATPLAVTEMLNGSGFFLGRGVGAIDPAFAGDNFTEQDWWSFQAQAGDRVSIAVDGRGTGVDPYVELYDAAGGHITSDGGSGANGD